MNWISPMVILSLGALLPLQTDTSVPLGGRLALLFPYFSSCPTDEAPCWISLPYLIIYFTSSSIIHGRHCPLSYRGHSTLPYLIPAYIIHRISLHELCIINTHTCSLFGRCSPDLFVLVTCEETLWAFLPINISVWAGCDSSPGWRWLT